jgi:hypothetical protein
MRNIPAPITRILYLSFSADELAQREDEAKGVLDFKRAEARDASMMISWMEKVKIDSEARKRGRT